MAPAVITEDYYAILEVAPEATAEDMKKAYKRLAMKRHPDKNRGCDEKLATKSFQLLSAAYETLADETRRRAYDATYKQQQQNRAGTQPTHQPRPAAPRDDDGRDHDEIRTTGARKQERGARWRDSRAAAEQSIAQQQKVADGLESELARLAAIDKSSETDAPSTWVTWLLSPLYRKPAETEEEKDAKKRERIERGHAQRLKQHRLGQELEKLRALQASLAARRQAFEADDAKDDARIVAARERIRVREEARRRRQDEEAARKRGEEEAKRRRQEEEAQRKQQEMWAKYWKDEAEARRKDEEERQAQLQREAEDAARAERLRKESHHHNHHHHRAWSAGSCLHKGWWPEVRGRATCGGCQMSWGYLLECPHCELRRCPGCQATLRGAIRRSAIKTRGGGRETGRQADWQADWQDD